MRLNIKFTKDPSWLITVIVPLFILPTNTFAFETKAEAAFVFDMTTGAVLVSKNADTPLPPASMSKLMTLYVAFEAIKFGQLKLDEVLPVSKHAQDYGGSTMFLTTRDRVSVEDLLLGIIVLSGNDACAVIAEALSPDGTEKGFAELLNRRARQIGLSNSVFKNSNGWPEKGHRMSMRDLAILTERLILDFPEFYPFFSQKEFLFDGRAPANKVNRNPLLGLGIGADGLKTGHTQEAGYGLVGSAKQDDRRLIFVFTGLSSAAERAYEAEAIVNWAFRQFSIKSFGKKDTRIAMAHVWNGDTSNVGLKLTKDLKVLVPVFKEKPVSFMIEYDSPIPAPIHAGQEIADLIIKAGDMEPVKIPLVAVNEVSVGGYFNRILTAAKVLLRDILGDPEVKP